ncbi:acyltransferase family protein [Cupriavidus lacunae]|uniref:acyltransferase family protein n=1 Tax=Cupriavidus lacunae TaxID=2666307 RepID=UPI001374FC3E|nr:acyltransferase [Cupriavidus lacunae]
MRQTTLSGIQSLRGVAALLVVCFHAALLVQRNGWTVHLAHLLDYWGRIGVDIFFVISGFVMVVIAGDRPRGMSVACNFMRDRIIRIAPVYWVLTGLMTLALAAAPSVFNTARFDWVITLASCLFIPTLDRAAGITYPILYVGWTLSYEMLFYLVFSAMLLLRREVRIPGLILIFGTAVIAGLAMRQQGFLAFLTDPITMEFVFGCIIGQIYQKAPPVSKRAGLVVLSLGGALAAASIRENIDLQWRALAWGLPAALIVDGAALMERSGSTHWPKLLRVLGDSSYSLYLTHIFVLPLIGRVLTKLDSARIVYGDMIWIGVISIAVLFGHIFYLKFEAPVTRYLRRKSLPIEARKTPA